MTNNLRYLALISIAILVLPFLIGFDDAYGATWYNSSWLKARKITIDQTDIDTADLTNYPLYVNMTSVNIGTDAQADCDDFVFTDSTNVTKLDHEIEQCDSTADWAEFWVEIPTVSNTVDTVIYMYYDNAAATDQQKTQETWNSNFAMIQHLNGTFLDSTSNANTCSDTGTSAVTTQYVGDSRSWDGSNDNIDCGSGASIDNIFSAGGTISAWIKPTTDGEAPAVVMTKRSAGTNGFSLRTVASATSPQKIEFISLGANDPVWATNSNEIAFSKWNFVAVTYNGDASGNDPLIYVNGTSVAITQTNADQAYVSDAANNLCLGNTNTCITSLTATFDGPLDEFRMNTAILTPEWIKADWECQKGATQNSIGPSVSCITVGSQGTEPASGSTVTVTDEYALEDSVSVEVPGIVTVSDEYALEDSVSATAANTVNPTDEFALEDSVSIPGNIVVTDEFALEDSAATNRITVSDEFALEDTTSSSAQNAVRNAIAIYLNSPTTTRLGGVFSGTCNFAGNYSMIGIYPNGTIHCAKLP